MLAVAFLFPIARLGVIFEHNHFAASPLLHNFSADRAPTTVGAPIVVSLSSATKSTLSNETAVPAVSGSFSIRPSDFQ